MSRKYIKDYEGMDVVVSGLTSSCCAAVPSATGWTAVGVGTASTAESPLAGGFCTFFPFPGGGGW
jgi:hypothetical protein